MCKGCWIEEGSPIANRPEVLAVVPMIAAVYNFDAVGGNLHCQLDDDNLEDAFFEKFIVYHPSSPEKLQTEHACFDAMAALTEPERRTALGLFDGYLQVQDGQIVER